MGEGFERSLRDGEHCFLASIVGCVAILVYQNVNPMEFSKGEFVTKKKLSSLGILDNPLDFIKQFDPAVGIDELPKSLINPKFASPSISEDNLWEKLDDVENILNEHGIEISFNLYQFHDEKVHSKIVSAKSSMTTSRLSSSVIISTRSQTNRPRSHATTEPISSKILHTTMEAERNRLVCTQMRFPSPDSSYLFNVSARRTTSSKRSD